MYYVIYFYFYPAIGYYIADVTILECSDGYDKKKVIERIKNQLTDKNKELTIGDDSVRIISYVDQFYSLKDAEAYIKENPIRPTLYSFSIQWHFTKKCNQHCVQCYLGSEQFDGMLKESELTDSELKLVVDNFYSFCYEIQASPVFVLTGGHPLLSDKLEIILSHIDNQYRKKGMLSNIFILGNPQYIEENIEMLERYNIDSYQISLDGTEKMHDEWRGKGSFAASMQALNILTKSTISPKIMATLSKKNAEDIIELYKYLCKNGAPYFAYSRLVPNCSERSTDYFQEHFTAIEYKDFLEKMFSVICEMKESGYKTQFIFKDHLWKPFLIEKGIWDLDERYGKNRDQELIYDGCHINQDSLCIGTNGNVYACMKTKSLLGNVKTNTFEEIYTSKQAEYFRDLDRYESCSICKYKHYCRGCHAVSYGVYGDFYKADPQCWIAESLR